jgi:hypothetical protein
MAPAARRPRRSAETITGRLRAADPFELIRWLARSQPDPRKALAELVQNSIDAGARRIQIARRRERGVTALHVLDDGEGVIPELKRSEALTYIATHIGHSRKRNLSPEQRRELMMQGKYGIGLLGFWSIGKTLEMRTQLPGAPPFVLRLYEDSPRYEIERLRSRLALGERYTEIVIRQLHRPAFLTLAARRIADYLASELRGQLLSREIEILVHDGIARGRAPKVLPVQPVRFSGQRLEVTESLAVDGYQPLRVELYLGAEEGAGRVSVSCGGTVVYDDLTQFEVADFQRPPWNDPRLSGLLEFPDFQVTPGTRRGVMPDGAALAFAKAVHGLEPAILALIGDAERRAAAAVEADLVKQLERAFRDLPRLAPEYDFFAVRAPKAAPLGASPDAEAEGDGKTGEPPAGAAVGEPAASDLAGDEEPPSLLPAGPLAAVRIVPAKTRVERLGRRGLRAEALDAGGIRIRRSVTFQWSTDAALGRLEPASGTEVAFVAGGDPGAAAVRVRAEEGERCAEGGAQIDIVEVARPNEARRAGIPEPLFVNEPAAAWRSRMVGSDWQVNSGHPSFLIASESARRKLRYLASLLAKEVVLHSFPAPQFGSALERLVEVMTIAERKIEKG